MAERAHLTQRDDIAVITIDRPPGNALTVDVRRALSDAVSQAEADAQTKGIVLVGAGRGFCPGVDISEYNGPLGAPWVDVLCDQIERCSKPVVAALHGAAMGAGFELALAAHGRVAHRDTGLAMPDVKLGTVPGGGATQRLPRLLGAQGALQILLSGEVLRASDARLNRLITQLTETHPLDPACDLARDLAAKGVWRRTRDADKGFSDPEGFQTALTAIQAQMNGCDGASQDILRCVEAAQLLPFDQGIAFEQSVFQDRLASPKARGARHFLMAEKFAAVAPQSGTTKAAQVRQIAIIGGQGRIGALALMLVQAGFGVALICEDTRAAEALAATIARALQGEVKRAAISQDVAQHRLALLDHTSGMSALDTADLVIDDGSVPVAAPAMPAHVVWAVLEPGASAAKRSASLGLDTPAIGMCAYQPIGSRHIIELSCGTQHASGHVATLMGVVAKLQKSPVLSTLQAGALRNRLSAALFGAATELAHHGADPYDVDAVAQHMGFAAGPFELMDAYGLTQVKTLLNRSSSSPNDVTDRVVLLDHLLEVGRSGHGAGQGFYSYAGGQKTQDTQLRALLPKPSAARKRAPLNRGLIRAGLLGALVNETACLMRGKHVRRVSDIDLVLVKGFGFNKTLGGPLLQVDLNGLFYLYKDMQQLSALSPLWQADPDVVSMVKQGQGFFGRSVG